jgi:hypothetical protein
LPVRQFTARKGQRHLSDLWWCATTGGHVGFESWLERDQLMLLDFDRTVSGIQSRTGSHLRVPRSPLCAQPQRV